MVGVANCPLCKVVHYCTGSNGTKNKCPLYRIAGSLLLRGVECIELLWIHSKLSVISPVSTVEGCPLSEVPLKTSLTSLLDNENSLFAMLALGGHSSKQVYYCNTQRCAWWWCIHVCVDKCTYCHLYPLSQCIPFTFRKLSWRQSLKKKNQSLQ